MKRAMQIAVVIAMALTGTLSGCSCWWEEDDGPTTVTIKGASGSDCTEDYQCQSNACVYPGRCQ